MKRPLLFLLATALAALSAAPTRAADPIPIVAAENFYGNVAQQIGGRAVTVTSILSNPDEDPHLFEASPSAARAMSAARIVIYSGIDYDPWAAKLLDAVRGTGRRVIVVAELIGKKSGDNPHIWYDPRTMVALAGTLAGDLSAIDPVHRTDYEGNLARFQQSIRPIEAKIASLRERLAGTPVTATEPIFGYMFAAMGMNVRNRAFQLSVMNNTEPSAADVANFENDLKTHKVKLLVYDRQTSDPIAARMTQLARASHIPVIGMAETEPPGETYQEWMMSDLDAIDRALPK